MEQLKSVNEAYKNLSMVVIQSAFDDLKTDKEIIDISSRIKKFNEKEELTRSEKGLKIRMLESIVTDRRARHFFISNDYKFFADILNAEYTGIYNMYLNIISGKIDFKTWSRL